MRPAIIPWGMFNFSTGTFVNGSVPRDQPPPPPPSESRGTTNPLVGLSRKIVEVLETLQDFCFVFTRFSSPLKKRAKRLFPRLATRRDERGE